MKITSSLFKFAALFLLSNSALAQNNFTIKMNMHMDGLPPEMAAMGDMEMVTYIKGDKLKSERTSMMGGSVTFYDGSKLTSLMENMGNKFGYTASKEELEAAEKNEKSEKPKIEYTSETKTIAGYECTKALVTSVGKDKKESKATIWFTDKISYAHRNVARSQSRGMMDLSELKGYPLAMEMSDSRNGMDVTMMLTTTEVSTATIDESVFQINTEGYKMMSYKEMLDKQKAMGGMGR